MIVPPTVWAQVATTPAPASRTQPSAVAPTPAQAPRRATTVPNAKKSQPAKAAPTAQAQQQPANAPKTAPADATKKEASANKPKAQKKANEKADDKDRKELRTALHKAYWKLGAIVKARIPGMHQFLVADYMGYFQPYNQCKNPFGNIDPKDLPLSEVNDILNEAQAAYVAFLTGREKEIGKIVYRSEPFKELPKNDDEVELNGVKCTPFFSRNHELYDETGKQPELTAKLLKRMGAESKGFMTPPMAEIMKKIEVGDPLTTFELSNLLLLMHGLRKYSRLVIDKARMHRQDGGVENPPELILPESLGKKLADLDRRTGAEQAALKVALGRPVEAFNTKDQIPRFVPCATKAQVCSIPATSQEFEENAFCLCDAKEENVQEMDERIMLELLPPDPTKPQERPHKSYLSATKQLAIKGRLVELAAANTFLPKDSQLTVPQACFNKDVDPYIALFNDLNHVSPRRAWIENLAKSVAVLEKEYREGTTELPVPPVNTSTDFYQVAENLVLGATKALTTERNKQISGSSMQQQQVVQTPAAEDQGEGGDGNANASLAGNLIKAMPFEERIREGKKTASQDLANQFGQKLALWSLLIQNDLEKLSDEEFENRNAVVEKMVREVLLYALSDALRVYGTNAVTLSSNEQVANYFNYLWDASYRPKWEAYLASSNFEPELNRMASAVTKRLMAYPGFEKKYDATAEADEIARRRVRELMPLYEEAVRAEQAEQYMHEHELGKKVIPALVSGGSVLPNWMNPAPGLVSTSTVNDWINPWNNFNYPYREAQVPNATLAPAPFQVADGYGREGQYPFFTLDPVTGMTNPANGRDYVIVKKGLQNIVGRTQKDITKKLIAKGFTDDLVRKSFRQEVKKTDGTVESLTIDSTDALTAQVIAKFNETLEANPYKDRGVVTRLRGDYFSALRKWMRENPQEATRTYEAAEVEFANALYDNYLRPKLTNRPKQGDTKEWKALFEKTLQVIHDREILIGKMDETIASHKTDQIVKLHEVYKAQEETLEKLHKTLTGFVDVNGVLLQNHVLDSPELWVKFATEYKDDKGKDALSWYDDATLIFKNQYLSRFFEERALFGTHQALNSGFLDSFGPKGFEYDGKNSLKKLAEDARKIGDDEPYDVSIPVQQWDGVTGTPNEKVPAVSAKVIPWKDNEPKQKAEWVRVWRVTGKNYAQGKYVSVKASSLRLNALPTLSVDAKNPLANPKALYIRLWLQDGLFANGKWDTALKRLDSIVPLGTSLNMPLTARQKAQKAYDAAISARAIILRDGWYGQDVAQINDLQAAPPAANDLLPEVDRFLSELSHRMHATEHKDKGNDVYLKASDFLTKKALKDHNLYDSWLSRMDVVRDQVRKAIEAKNAETLKTLYPHARFLFSRLPVFILGRSVNTGTVTWAKDDFVKSMREVLFPSFETFRENVLDLMVQAEAPKKDPATQIEEAEKTIERVQQELWQLDREEVSLFGYIERGRRFVFDNTVAKLIGYDASDKFNNEEIRKNKKEEIDRATELRDRARLDLKAATDLNRILSNYLPKLPEAQTARVVLAEQLKPEFWDAFFKDQFLNTSEDLFGKPLTISAKAPVAIARVQTITPARVLEDLNEIAKVAKGTASIQPGVASEYMEDLVAYCKAGNEPRMADAFARNYQQSLLTDAKLLSTPRSFALVQNLWTNPGNLKELGNEAQFSIHRLKQIWNLREGRSEVEKKTSFLPVALNLLGQVMNTGVIFDASPLAFPSIKEACETLEKRATVFKTQMDTEWAKEHRILPTTALAYWEEIVEPATALFQGPSNTFGPIALVSDAGKMEKQAWFRHGPTDEYPDAKAAVERRKTDATEAQNEALIAFFGLNALTPEMIKKIVGEEANLPAKLTSEDVKDRLTVVSHLTPRERESLYTKVRGYLSGLLLAEPSFKAWKHEMVSREGNADDGFEFSGFPEVGPQGVSPVVQGQAASTPRTAQPVPPGAKPATANPAKPTPALAPVVGGTKPVVTKPPTANRLNPAASTAVANGQAASLAPPAPPAPSTAVVGIAPPPPLSDTQILFQPLTDSSLTYQKWVTGVREKLALWDKLKKDPNFSGTSTVLFDALTTGIFTDFVGPHTHYRLEHHRLFVPKTETQNNRLRTGLVEFTSYSNIERYQIIEDIRELFFAEENRLRSAHEQRVTSLEAKKNSLKTFEEKEKERKEKEKAEEKGVKDADAFTPEPFKKELAFESNSYQHDSDARLLEFWQKHFSDDTEEARTKDGQPKTEYAGVSVNGWGQYWREKNGKAEVPYFKNEQSKAFTWKWAPSGEQTEESFLFQNWLSDLSSDSDVKSAFTEKTAKRFKDNEWHLWDAFDSIEEFKKSPLYGQILTLMQQADRNARTTSEPGTYPYFLALLNWNLNPNRYGVIPDVSTGINQGPLKDVHRAGLMREITDHLKWNLKSFDGWEWVLKSWGRAEDWRIVAQGKRDFLIAVGDRRMGNSLVGGTYVENPNWVPGKYAARATGINTFGATYGFRPTPVHPLERRSFSAFKSPEEYLNWVQNPKNYLSYRINGDDVERPLYQQMVATKNELVGEWNLRENNPLKRDRMNNRGRSDALGGEFRFIDAKGPRATAIVDRAKLLGIKTSGDEVARVVKVREAWIDFRRQVDELRVKYPFEGAVYLQKRGNSVAIDGGWALSTDAAKRIPGMLQKFADQVGYPNQPQLPWAGKTETYGLGALYEADRIAEWAVLGSATPANRKRLEAVEGVIGDYYTEEVLLLEYQRGAKRIGDNIVGRLDKLCTLDVENIETDEQFERASAEIKSAELVYFDNVLDFVNDYMPEGASRQAYYLLEELKTKRSLGQRLTEDYLEPFVAVGLGVMLVGSYFLKGPIGSGTGLALASHVGRLSLTLLFGYQVSMEVGELLYFGPERLKMLANIRDTDIEGYLPLMKDETGIMISDAARDLKEERGSVLGWMWRGWLALAAWQLASPTWQSLKGGWSAMVRKFGGEEYAKRQLVKQLKELGMAESELKEVGGQWKSASQLHEILETRSEKAFTEALSSGVDVFGNFSLDPELAKSYQRLVEKRITALQAQGGSAEAMARAFQCRAQVNASTPFISSQNLVFLHGSGESFGAQMMPTAIQVVGIPETAYDAFNWGVTKIGRGLRASKFTRWAASDSLIRPSTLLNEITPAVSGFQRSRQLLVFRRLSEVVSAADYRLRVTFAKMNGRVPSDEDMAELLTALFDDSHPMAAKLKSYLPAQVDARQVGADSKTVVEELATPQGREKLDLLQDINEIKSQWNLGGLPQDTSSAEFKKFIDILARKDFDALAAEMGNPGRVLLASLRPTQDALDAEAKAHVPYLDPLTAEKIKRLKVEKLALAFPTNGYLQLLYHDLLPAAEADSLKGILSEGLTSAYLERRLGMLRFRRALSEEQVALHKKAIRLTRAMEDMDARYRFVTPAKELGKTPINPQEFNTLAKRYLNAEKTMPQTFAEAHGVVFGEMQELAEFSASDLEEYYALQKRHFAGQTDQRLLEESYQLLRKLTSVGRPGSGPLSLENLSAVLSVPPEILVSAMGNRTVLLGNNFAKGIVTETLLGRTLPLDLEKRVSRQLSVLLTEAPVLTLKEATDALGIDYLAVANGMNGAMVERYARVTRNNLQNYFIKFSDELTGQARELAESMDPARQMSKHVDEAEAVIRKHIEWTRTTDERWQRTRRDVQARMQARRDSFPAEMVQGGSEFELNRHIDETTNFIIQFQDEVPTVKAPARQSEDAVREQLRAKISKDVYEQRTNFPENFRSFPTEKHIERLIDDTADEMMQWRKTPLTKREKAPETPAERWQRIREEVKARVEAKKESLPPQMTQGANREALNRYIDETTDAIIRFQDGLPAKEPVSNKWRQIETEVRARVQKDVRARMKSHPQDFQGWSDVQVNKLIDEQTDEIVALRQGKKIDPISRSKGPNGKPPEPPPTAAVPKDVPKPPAPPAPASAAPEAAPAGNVRARLSLKENPRVKRFVDAGAVDPKSVEIASENGSLKALQDFKLQRAMPTDLAEQEQWNKELADLKTLHLLDEIETLESEGIIDGEKATSILQAGIRSYVRSELHQIEMTEDMAYRDLKEFVAQASGGTLLRVQITEAQYVYGELYPMIAEAHQKLVAKAASMAADQWVAQQKLIARAMKAIERQVLAMPEFAHEGKLIKASGIQSEILASESQLPFEMLVQPEMLKEPEVLARLLKGPRNTNARKTADHMIQIFGDTKVNIELSSVELQREAFDLQVKERWLNTMGEGLFAQAQRDSAMEAEFGKFRTLFTRSHSRIQLQGGKEIPPFIDFTAAAPQGTAAPSAIIVPKTAQPEAPSKLWLPPGSDIKPPPEAQPGTEGQGPVK